MLAVGEHRMIEWLYFPTEVPGLQCFWGKFDDPVDSNYRIDVTGPDCLWGCDYSRAELPSNQPMQHW